MKSILLICIAAFTLLLGGCASLCSSGDTKCQQDAQNADGVLSDAAAIVVGAAVIAADIEAPPTVTTETRTCSTDSWGNKTCTTTEKGN